MTKNNTLTKKKGKKIEVVFKHVQSKKKIDDEVTPSGGRNAYRYNGGIGLDDRQPAMTLQ